MLRFIFLASIISFISACSFKHIAEVRMQNNQNEPVIVRLQAKNISFISDTMPAFSKQVKPWNWTNLESGEGHVNIDIFYPLSGATESYEAGQFSQGILSNYIDISVQKGNLQCKMSD
ncbi:MAG: hypothetical protein FGM54_09655 [Chitinophagaceae bacterium]|nr:hypothetical protein [Chitinophagaceae bacterium]